jgi:hypothetical protein
MEQTNEVHISVKTRGSLQMMTTTFDNQAEKKLTTVPLRCRACYSSLRFGTLVHQNHAGTPQTLSR